MKFEYRPEAIHDLEWFKEYYFKVFPEGAIKARQHFESIQDALLAYPQIGHPIVYENTLREITIPKTPFSIVYTISDSENMIIILRVLDNRAQRPTVFITKT